MLLPVSYMGTSKGSPILFFHQKLTSLASYSSTHPIQDLLPHVKLPYWLCSTLSQGLLVVSQFLLYLVVPPFGLRGHLIVPRTRTFMTQYRSFAIVGPSNWNKLPQSLIYLFPISSDQFRKAQAPENLTICQ